jgi:hypothetical protein
MHVIIDRNKLIEVTTLFHFGIAQNMIARDKHSSILDPIVSWEENKVS